MLNKKLIAFLSSLPDDVEIKMLCEDYVSGIYDEDIDAIVVVREKHNKIKYVYLTNDLDSCVEYIISEEMYDTFEEFIESVYCVSNQDIDYNDYIDNFDVDEDDEDDTE
jgi:hypothetical protein